MIDPAVLGTAIIGLDRVRRDAAWTDQPADTAPRRPTRHHGRNGLTRLAATILRRFTTALPDARGRRSGSARPSLTDVAWDVADVRRRTNDPASRPTPTI